MQSFNSSIQWTRATCQLQGGTVNLNGPGNSFYSAGEIAAIMFPHYDPFLVCRPGRWQVTQQQTPYIATCHSPKHTSN